MKLYLKNLITAAIAYEKATGRNSGITGEVGEALVADACGLKLNPNNVTAGYDAIKRGKLYQIKARRMKGNQLVGRIGSVSSHSCDYILLGLLNDKYELLSVHQMTRTEFDELSNEVTRRNPTLRSFISHAKLVWSRK